MIMFRLFLSMFKLVFMCLSIMPRNVSTSFVYTLFEPVQKIILGRYDTRI